MALAWGESQFLRAQSLDQLVSLDLELLPICRGMVRSQIQRRPWTERLAVNLGPSIESPSNAGKATGSGQRIKRPLVVNDPDPVHKLQGFGWGLLQGLQQLLASAAAFRLYVEVEDVLKLIEVCRELTPALQRLLAESVELKNPFSWGRTCGSTTRRWWSLLPAAPTQLLDLHLICHGLDDKSAQSVVPT